MYSETTEKLSSRIKLGYGTGEIAATLFFSVLGFFLLNYLTDDLGLSAGLAGTAIMIGKLWDAFSDPMVGYLSDRTRTGFGRRRPWILCGALPLGFFFFYLFSYPSFTGTLKTFLWVCISYILLCTAYTVVNIPYISLIPEMSKDFNERTSINAYRSVFSITGTLLGAGAALPLINLFSSRISGIRFMGLFFGTIMAISAILPIFFVKEKSITQINTKSSFISSYKEAFGNKIYIIILTVFCLATTGITLITSSLIYYFKYILGNENQLTTSLIILMASAMLFIPVVNKISARTGKKEIYSAGLLLIIFSLLLIFLTGDRVPIEVLFLYMAIAGIGFSTHFVMPWSMLPDTLEYDYVISGKRREGVFFGLWTLMSKIGGALAIFIGGNILSLFSYVPNTRQTTAAEWGIKLLIGPVTIIFFTAALLLLQKYDFNEEQYKKMLQKTGD